MKVAIAADHGGFELKSRLIQELKNMGHDPVDFGPATLDPVDDYPDYGRPAAQAVADARVDRAILICNNGIGMGMLANKIPGVRAAVVYSEKTARQTRRHHDSNVLCLGGQEFSTDELMHMIQIWLTTDFEGGRHERRMGKVRAIETT